jgi:hypothetical protein
VARAKAQGYKAERMLPKWIKPVGDGANRVRVFFIEIVIKLRCHTIQCSGQTIETNSQIVLYIDRCFQTHGDADHALADSG